MKLSLSMSHSISIRLGHSVIPEADTFSQLSCLYFCVPSFPSLPSPLWVRSSAWKQMNGTTRDDGWSVAFIIITIVRDVMAAFSLCLERPLPPGPPLSLLRRPSFGIDVIFSSLYSIEWGGSSYIFPWCDTIDSRTYHIGSDDDLLFFSQIQIL